MDDFDKYLKDQLSDPVFQEEWNDREIEYQQMMRDLKSQNEQQE